MWNTKKDRIWIISVKIYSCFYNAFIIAANVYAGALSEESKFEIIGHFQQGIHDTW